jgi:hypothetical protein
MPLPISSGTTLRTVATLPLIQHLHARLQPVIHAYPSGEAEVYGSSVLLQVSQRFFFTSAAHVLKTPPAGAALEVVGDSQNIRLPVEAIVGGKDSHSSLGPAEGLIDVAFVEVSSTAVTRLGGAAAVQMDEVDVNESLKPTMGAYLALGYPISETKVIVEEGAVHVNPFALHTGRTEPEIYVTLGVSEHTHLVLRYDPASITWPDGIPRVGPSPHGMSGGGVWRVRNSYPALPGPLDAKLVAVMIEHRAGEHAIIATRIALQLEGMRLRHPELDSYIPRTTAVKLNVNRG